MNIIPSTVTDAFKGGLPLRFYCIFHNVWRSAVTNGAKRQTPRRNCYRFHCCIFKIVDMIMLVSAYWCVGAIAFTIGKYGIASLGPLAKLLGIFYITCIIFVIVVLKRLLLIRFQYFIYLIHKR